jgi:hypothetical protein
LPSEGRRFPRRKGEGEKRRKGEGVGKTRKKATPLRATQD